MISSITSFFTRNRKLFYYMCFFLFLYSISGDITFADPKEVVVVEDADKWGKLAGTINTALIGLSAIVGIFTYFITLFLEPGWINGTIFGLDVRFREVWILVSNVVYFIFAFLLIWIAFMNIIGKGQDKYQLKQALPKFIIGVLIVPFSWFFVQFILSISAILTVSALSLPYNTFDDIKAEINKIDVPTKCYVNIKSLGSSNSKDKKDDKADAKLTEEEKEHKGDLFWCAEAGVMGLGDSMDSSSFGLISIYSYGILNLNEISKIKSKDITDLKIESIGDLIIHVVFNVLFVVIYMVLIMALGLVLIVRGIYLWLYTMLSPVFGLMYFFDKNEGGGEGFFSKFNFKQFISLALVPVYVMLALSFGFLFIFVILHGIKDPGNADVNKTITTPTGRVSITNTGITVHDLGDGGKDFNLYVKGALSEKTVETGVAKKFYNLGSSGLGIIGDLILKMLGIVVLWISIMSALKASDITKAVVAPLDTFGGQVGGLIAKSPQYLPIFGGQSMQSINQIGSSATSHFDNKSRERGTDFLKKHKLFGQTAESESKAANALAAIESLKGGLNKEAVSKFADALHGYDSAQKMSNSKTMVQAATVLAKNLGIDDKYSKDAYGKQDVMAKLIARIDDKLHHSKAGQYGDIVKGKEFSSTDADMYNGAALTKYLNKTKDGTIDTSDAGNASGTTKVGDIVNPKGDNRFDIKFGNVSTTIETDGNDKLVGESEYQLARAIQQGLKGDDLKSTLDNLGIVGGEQKNVLKGVLENLWKDDDGKLSLTKNGDFKNKVKDEDIFA